MSPAELGFFSSIWAQISTNPTAALIFGLMLGLLVGQGRAAVRWLAVVIRAWKTGEWETNGYARQQDMLETKRILGDISKHQAGNFKITKEMMDNQKDHDDKTRDAILAARNDIAERLDRLIGKIEGA